MGNVTFLKIKTSTLDLQDCGATTKALIYTINETHKKGLLVVPSHFVKLLTWDVNNNGWIIPARRGKAAAYLFAEETEDISEEDLMKEIAELKTFDINLISASAIKAVFCGDLALLAKIFGYRRPRITFLAERFRFTNRVVTTLELRDCGVTTKSLSAMAEALLLKDWKPATE